MSDHVIGLSMFLRSFLYEIFSLVKFIETDNRRKADARGWGKWDGELMFSGDRVSVWEDEKCSEDG